MTSAIQGAPGLPQSALPSIQTGNEAADAPPPTEVGTVEGKRREYLPDDLRIHVLTRVKALLDRCPPALMLSARRTLADAVNVLPIALIDRLTSLQPT